MNPHLPQLDGFRQESIETAGSRLNLVHGGSGPPLLLLHGHPQTHVMWRKLAPGLAERFTVVAPDLRGYGDSSKPPSDERHEPYSKRAMARDMVELMRHLGFQRFRLAGHDRGGRVAHRLAIDHPDAVERLAVLDIAPTHAMYTGADMDFARSYYHWFFLIQPFDLPERLIGADPEYFLRRKMGQWPAGETAHTESFIGEAAMAEYLRCYTPATIHAICEDYRASAGIDLEHDEASLAAGERIECKLLALWGANGFVGRKYDVLQEWRRWASDVSGRPLPCGHYLAEEAPEETLAEFLRFFG